MKDRGYTLVELIMTMVIVGILAAVIAPKFFDSSVFQSRGFADQLQATLRHAQKIAIASNRFVCVAANATSVTLTIDPTPRSLTHPTATCPGNNLTDPGGHSPYSITAPGNVTQSGLANFNLDELGRPSFTSTQSITISGYATPISIEAETGYVH